MIVLLSTFLLCLYVDYGTSVGNSVLTGPSPIPASTLLRVLVVTLLCVMKCKYTLNENNLLNADNKANMGARGHQRWHYEWQMELVSKLNHLKWPKRRHSFPGCCTRMRAYFLLWLMRFSHALHSNEIFKTWIWNEILWRNSMKVLLALFKNSEWS